MGASRMNAKKKKKRRAHAERNKDIRVTEQPKAARAAGREGASRSK